MGKRSCTISLLSGVMTIVTLGSVIGSLAGYALSGAVIGLLSALSKSVSFSTEFSNWAVLEQGKCDINWFHSTPKSGVSPITQWVMQMDIQQRKLTG